MDDRTKLAQICELLHEALDLTVRGRTLDAIQRRTDTLAASVDGEAWQASGRFDDHVARHNATHEPTMRPAFYLHWSNL